MWLGPELWAGYGGYQVGSHNISPAPQIRFLWFRNMLFLLTWPLKVKSWFGLWRERGWVRKHSDMPRHCFCSRNCFLDYLTYWLPWKIISCNIRELIYWDIHFIKLTFDIFFFKGIFRCSLTFLKLVRFQSEHTLWQHLKEF